MSTRDVHVVACADVVHFFLGWLIRYRTGSDIVHAVRSRLVFDSLWTAGLHSSTHRIVRNWTGCNISNTLCGGHHDHVARQHLVCVDSQKQEEDLTLKSCSPSTTTRVLQEVFAA